MNTRATRHLIAIATAIGAITMTAVASDPIEVINAGKGGNNTRHLLKRVDQVLAESKPDMVVLMVGTNDALNSKAMVPVDEYRKNLGTLIEKFRAAGAQPMLMTILPCHAPYVIARHGEEAFAKESPEERIAAVNQVIREVSKEEKLLLIDTHHLFTVNRGPSDDSSSLLRNQANSNSTDGVHPTADGQRVIATAIYLKLQSFPERPRRILCLGDSITYGAHMRGDGSVTSFTYPGLLSKWLNQPPKDDAAPK